MNIILRTNIMGDDTPEDPSKTYDVLISNEQNCFEINTYNYAQAIALQFDIYTALVKASIQCKMSEFVC